MFRAAHESPAFPNAPRWPSLDGRSRNAAKNHVKQQLPNDLVRGKQTNPAVLPGEPFPLGVSNSLQGFVQRLQQHMRYLSGGAD